MTEKDTARFLKKIAPAKWDDCWLWTDKPDTYGYGQFCLNGKKPRAHRVSYELFEGKIPDGLIVRHTCHRPLCVNPAHLIVGTQQDNMDDRQRAGRQAKGETNGRAKLPDSAVREIRDLAGRFTQREIGEMYGVSQQQISLIINNKTWKEIK